MTTPSIETRLKKVEDFYLIERNKLVEQIRILRKEHGIMKNILEELAEYKRGRKCIECGYRLLEHRADKAREALSQITL